MEIKNVVSPALFNEMVGIESIQDFRNSSDSSTSSKLERLFGGFTNDSYKRVEALTRQFIKPSIESSWVTDEIKVKAFMTDADNALHRLSKECIANNQRFAMLPNEISNIIKPSRALKMSLENKIAKGGVPHQEKFMKQFMINQLNVAMENTVFNALASMHNEKYGIESYSYNQNTIFYPKLETMLQFISVPNTIYNKLIKSKVLLNTVTSIPVHYEDVMVCILDDAGNVVNQAKRQDLYLADDPEKVLPGMFNTMYKEVTLSAAELNTRLDLYRTPITSLGNKPMLTANESVRADFYITKFKAGGKEYGKVHAFSEIGTIKTETVSEADYNGAVIEYPLDGDPNEVVYFNVRFSGAEQSLRVITSKGNNATKSVEEVTIRFKLIDIHNTIKSNLDFRIQRSRQFINAGEERKIDLPIIQSQLDIINERDGGDFFAKLMSLAAENIAHHFDEKMFKGYDEMRSDLIKQYAENPNHILYANSFVDMRIPTEVNKPQTLNFYLGPVFQNLIRKLTTKGNSQSAVQLNMFCSSYHLDVLGSNLQVITGEVNEETDGKFLGVEQQVRTHVMTIGTDTSSPISAIVVGTDKNKYKAKIWKDGMERQEGGLLPEWEVEYNYQILPYYKEDNIETNLLVSTPTRVISDNSLRSSRRPYIPNMQMYYTVDFRTLRGAAADLRIKGYHIHVLPTE